MKYVKKVLEFIFYPVRYVVTAYNIMNQRAVERKKRHIAWAKFIIDNKEAVHGWYEIHGLDKKPPVVYDQQGNRFKWVHREHRRNILQQLKKRGRK